MRKHQGYDNCSRFLEKILPHKYAQNIQTGLDTRFGKLSSPRRAISSLNDFLSFIADHDVLIETSNELSLFFHNYQEVYMVEKRDLAPSTVSSNLNALRVTITMLQELSVFPSGHITPVQKQADKELFQDASNDAKKVLGGLELPTQPKDEETPLPLRLNVPADEFLSSLVSNIRKHRNTILHISRRYLAEASCRLDYKKVAIDFVSESLFDDPEHLALGVSTKGQRYSLFNKDRLGEVARMNLVAYLHYKQNGLITDNFKGRTHLSSFGGTGELREYFGLSTLSAVAAQNIIVAESGVNIDNLREFKVGANGCLKDSFRLTDDGFNIIYDKLRAKSTRNKDMLFVDDSDINTSFAFNYLIRSTEHYRSLVSPKDKDYLFIHDTMQDEGVICRISSMPFKDGFIKLLVKAKERISQDPNWCELVTVDDIDDLLMHDPNAKQLRVSEGILRWYDSGGDPFVASNYLGNTESVALNNYIPLELQGVLYSQQISKFQHLLLAAATDKKSYQKEVLQLDSADGSDDNYELYMGQLDALNPNWRKLAESDVENVKSKGDEAFALIMNKENVSRLFKAFEKQNKDLQNGLTPQDDTLLLSDIFKSLVSYVNAYGKRDQRNMLRDTITSVGESK
ncbi:hypothetical protein AB4559_03290 [Vibrio sp. 10N.222.51.C8]|uniref:hypothetical protein n=1 Tax=Vibrio sp. 10N.222.51.C8 TaxID=3229624 RepID=UPI0035532A90